MIILVAMVQLVNVLDFVMVMPLGQDFARALDIDEARLGWIGGSYTLAAAFSGIVSARFLDRYDRRKALAIAMLGLVCATAALAQDSGPLIDLLVKKGIINDQEGEDLRAELAKDFAASPAGKLNISTPTRKRSSCSSANPRWSRSARSTPSRK